MSTEFKGVIYYESTLEGHENTYMCVIIDLQKGTYRISSFGTQPPEIQHEDVDKEVKALIQYHNDCNIWYTDVIDDVEKIIEKLRN